MYLVTSRPFPHRGTALRRSAALVARDPMDAEGTVGAWSAGSGIVADGSSASMATPQLLQKAAPVSVPRPHPGHAVVCVIAPPHMR